MFKDLVQRPVRFPCGKAMINGGEKFRIVVSDAPGQLFLAQGLLQICNRGFILGKNQGKRKRVVNKYIDASALDQPKAHIPSK